jgi:hypothetical protein
MVKSPPPNVERNYFYGRAAGVHLRLVEGEHPHTLKRRAGAESEHFRRHVETVGPDAELWIVVQIVRNLL